MPKKTDDKEREVPSYDKLKSVEEVDALIAKYQEELHRRTKQHLQAKQNKKDEVASFNEVIKETAEDIDHVVGVLDELKLTKTRLDVPGGFLKAVKP